jgi:3-methylcrotonyl-CoA carboxylase beta subunit
MTVIHTALDTRADEFQANAARMRGLVEDLRAQVEKVRRGGGDRARKRHVERGKMLPRERVRDLLDPGSPFLELSQLAAHGMYGDDAPGAGRPRRLAGNHAVAGSGPAQGANYFNWLGRTDLTPYDVRVTNK